MKWIKEIIKLLKSFKKDNFKFFIVTNQSGIARNFYSEKMFLDLHAKIKNFLIKQKYL